MTLAMPHSTVNESNYGTLGNQLKGESHASRMKRVHAMRRMDVGPTLQPLGSAHEATLLDDWSAQIGGPIALSAVVGMILGAANKGSLAKKDTSKAKGIFGAMSTMGLGAGIGALSVVGHAGFAASEGEDLVQLAGLTLVSALAAGLGHGFTRATGHWASS